MSGKVPGVLCDRNPQAALSLVGEMTTDKRANASAE
jgi:hypothetical protein